MKYQKSTGTGREAREGGTGHGGQATEKHRAGQVTEGGESFPENWRCST